MALCEKLNLDRDTYSVSIPLGATINMAGRHHHYRADAGGGAYAGIPVDLPTALLLSVVASLCACGASGVAGGSLLLIPLACNMFGIPNDIAMQVVAVGFIIGVLQDSCETALNSSTDVLFTAAACMAEDEQLAKTRCAINPDLPLRSSAEGPSSLSRVSILNGTDALHYNVTPLLKIASSRKSLRSLQVGLPLTISTRVSTNSSSS
jgi:hypothetical protein